MRCWKKPGKAAWAWSTALTIRTSTALSRSNCFVRGFTEKLMIYALARGIERYDRPTVAAIADRLPSRDYKFSELVLEIVNSLPIQMRRAGE
jgi:hypothetical protein